MGTICPHGKYSTSHLLKQYTTYTYCSIMCVDWSTQRCWHTYELCDSGSIVVDIDTITVLLMRARLVSPATALPEVLQLLCDNIMFILK